ncbi:hypothetical protein GCM10009616_13530 [Microlunatus lacustris]
MFSLSTRERRPTLSLAAAVAAAGLVVAGAAAPTPARAMAFSLPLGDADLTEVRSVQPLARGVELVRIVRGVVPTTLAIPSLVTPRAPVERGTVLPDSVTSSGTPTDAVSSALTATTTRGPWRVSILSVDPRIAGGHLRATYGPDLSQVETTSELVRQSGALAGVNASFFTFDKSPQYPGEPVGLGIYRGAVLSEPAAVRPEVDFVLDARTSRVLVGRLTWTGSMKNRTTDVTLRLDHLNHPPVVPASCTKIVDPTTCTASGDVVHVDRRFGPTPKGRGVEVVLDRSGCLVRLSKTRGTVLASGQSAVQATGRQTLKLLALVKKGCLSRRVTLLDEKKKAVKLTSSTFGVAGRYRLTERGRVVVPRSSGSFFSRHPRTIAGQTSDGKILLVTIDGRQAGSVGATLSEAAAVAQALDLTDSVNLDGGGSTAMVAGGMLVNQPSGGIERRVGDALVYVDKPFS